MSIIQICNFNRFSSLLAEWQILYVTCYRVGSENNLCIYAKDQIINNIVYNKKYCKFVLYVLKSIKIHKTVLFAAPMLNICLASSENENVFYSIYVLTTNY